MSNKGVPATIDTKYKISIARQQNRTEVQKKLEEYVLLISDVENKTLIPSIVSASLYAGMGKKALLAWELETAEDSELRQILEFVRDLEEKYLRDNGLTRQIDGKMAKGLLEAEHGLQAKPQNLTQNNNFNISPDLLADALALSRQAKSPKSKT